MRLSRMTAIVLDNVLNWVDLDLNGKVSINFREAASQCEVALPIYIKHLHILKGKGLLSYRCEEGKLKGIRLNLQYFPNLSLQAVFESPYFSIYD